MQRSSLTTRLGVVSRSLGDVHFGFARALVLAVLVAMPASARAEEPAAPVEGSRYELPSADPGEALSATLSGWLHAYEEAIGSETLAGATLGAGTFALLAFLYSSLVQLRGQRRHARLLDPARRAQARPAAERQRPASVPAPPKVAPAPQVAPRSLLDSLDLVIEPIEEERPRSAGARPGTATSMPATAPEQAGPRPLAAGPRADARSPERETSAPGATALAQTEGIELCDADLPVPRTPEPMDAEGRIAQCFALLAEGRFQEAVQVTREGLNGHPDAARVLGELSRVASLLGHDDDAIDLATRAYAAGKSEERLKRLLQLRCNARRFGPRAGERLRIAVAQHPEEPVYLRALGIFESLHGDRAAARRLLRAALRHETAQETRGAIARELLKLEERDLAA